MAHLSKQNWIYAVAYGLPEALRLLADEIVEYKCPADHWLNEQSEGVIAVSWDEEEAVYRVGCCVSYSKDS
jgi:hypothetical protein